MKKITFLLLLTTFSFSASFIVPIPEKVPYDKGKALLGKKLFFETRLSKTNTISCNSCHNLETSGSDNLQFSFGIDAQVGNINSPTVFNALFNFRQLWSGGARTLEEQAKGPLTNPIEMGHNIDAILSFLRKDKEYKTLFQKNYKDGVTEKNLLLALEEFEKTLFTPNSPFDQFLKGDKKAISDEAKEGYKIFISKGCVSCHNGVNIGGNSFAKFGVVKEVNSNRSGLFDVTKQQMDKNFFKVPTLRNIELTYPYFHNGEVKTLKDAIKLMASYQIGTILSDKEIGKIEAFLKTLNGKVEIIHD